jgi:hypothetical protein
MATKTYEFTGTVKWLKTRPDKYDNYSLQFYPETAAVRKEIKATGFKGNIKEDEDGNFFYTFRRKSKDGVFDVVYNGEDFDGLVGNGSRVVVGLDVYDFKEGVDSKGVKYAGGFGSRVKYVRVLDLVEYVRPEADAPAPAPEAPAPKAKAEKKAPPF